MKSKLLFSIFLCFCCNMISHSQSCTYESLKFPSKLLGKEVAYSIYLPSDYKTSDRHYPVLYLLHGYTDNETMWVQAGEVKEITDYAIANGNASQMIIVMPDAWDTFYINQYDGKAPYEDMFFQELIPYIEKTYRARAQKEYRAIAGLSMGGYGSFLYTLHHPDYFAACAPLSAAVFDDNVMKQRQERSHKELFTRLYGLGLDHWHKNSILEILSGLTNENLPQVRYYIDCGDEDILLEGNFQAHKIMTEKGIKHEFRVRDGKHSWEYWRSALPEVLKFVSQAFKRS